MNKLIERWAKDQYWAKATPIMGIISGFFLFYLYSPSDPMFWALINIPLYLFHQAEEHFWPGGFKRYVNQVVNKLPPGQERLDDISIFWINIILVWFVFAIFGVLAQYNIAFGILIIIFSMINCVLHVVVAIIKRGYNPGFVVASFQLTISIFAAKYVTESFENPVSIWVKGIVFSIIVHIIIFRVAIKGKLVTKKE